MNRDLEGRAPGDSWITKAVTCVLAAMRDDSSSGGESGTTWLIQAMTCRPGQVIVVPSKVERALLRRMNAALPVKV